MEATLKAIVRDERGKNEARRLRQAGRVPAVVYGGGAQSATPVSVDPKAVLRILHSDAGVNTLIGLSLDGSSDARVLIKEYQLDPITHQLLHLDFYRVAMDRTITVTVPVLLKGDARGVKQQGGILDFVHRDIQIECLPADIPEHLEVDVSELMLGQSIRVRDLPLSAKWKPVTEPETMLVHVIALRVEEPAPAAAEVVVAAPVEPEVIKKGKVEKEKTEE
ncbi:MAG: 50S ribosomal protein L25 [Acidobacteria bacterium]|nr:50S ribosomal protein L25 [Acidobacteriota bacterium]